MTADIELLPLPEADDSVENRAQWPIVIDSDVWLQKSVQDYARACVAHAAEPLIAEIERLRAEVAKAERSVEHTHQWYAVRLEKIKEVAKRVGLWSEISAIIANGSGSIYDPPTYAQQLNIAKHETKAAEARAERMAEALRRAEGLLRSAGIIAESDLERPHSIATEIKNALRDHEQEASNG